MGELPRLCDETKHKVRRLFSRNETTQSYAKHLVALDSLRCAQKFGAPERPTMKNSELEISGYNLVHCGTHSVNSLTCWNEYQVVIIHGGRVF